MKTNDLTFTSVCAPFADRFLRLSKNRLAGTEIYTYCMLSPGNLYGQLWAGVDSAGALAAALLDNGHCRTFLTPSAAFVGDGAGETADFFLPVPATGLFRVMLKEAPAKTADPVPVKLTGSALLKAAAARRGRPPTQTEEMRDVYYARAVNAGLSDAFVFPGRDGAPCASAQIVAKNLRYALIGNVYTLPPYRRQGMAGRLLAACENRAAEEGLLPVLYCREHMTSFYRAHGYRIVKENEL